ncbi:MAG: hypothetical protein QXW06_04260, partial [Thermoplasmata archaeon]
MPDLRERVEEDRGIIKKIQSVIPGYAGYRRREDLRAADNLLRIQMAERLGRARTEVEKCRKTLVDNMATQQLDSLGQLINRFKSVEGQLRHAEGGYSGISPTIRIEEPELNQLYEYDLSLVNHILSIEQGVLPLRNAVTSGSA